MFQDKGNFQEISCFTFNSFLRYLHISHFGLDHSGSQPFNCKCSLLYTWHTGVSLFTTALSAFYGVTSPLPVFSPALQTELEEEEYSRQPTFSLTERAHHIVHLHHPLTIHNLLPYSISLGEEGYSMVLIGSGCQANINYTKLSHTQKFLVEVCSALPRYFLMCEGVTFTYNHNHPLCL